MRDFTADGATQSGVPASGPVCRICRQIFTSGSAACTAVVICRCCSASAGVDSLPPTPACVLGAMPPVMIMPTPPRARSA
jgi:hypothetical protein